MPSKVLRLAAATALVSALAFSAHAGNPPTGSAADALTEMSQLNLVVLGNMSAGADVEGKTFIAGNLANANTMGNGSSANPTQGFAPSTFPTLTVGGNITGNLNINNGSNGGTANGITPAGVTVGGSVQNLNLNASNATVMVGGDLGTNGGNGANIQIGGSLTGNQNPTHATLATGVAGLANTLISQITSEATTLSNNFHALAATLSGLTANGTYNDSDQNADTFTAVDNGQGYSVIDITAAQLNAAQNFVFDIPQIAGGGYLTTIVNVIDPNDLPITINANSNNNSAYNPYLIFNFGDLSCPVTSTNPNGTCISFDRQFNGSVLAPDANITNSSPINGSGVVNSFIQGGEIHLGTSKGFVPMPPPPPIGTPEPAVWALMLLGFGSVGAALRCRRSRAAAAA